MNEGDTHYEVLGVSPGATKETIRAAYREQLAEAQADVTREETAKRPSDDAIATARQSEARVRAAWQTLSDPIQRQRYDESNGIDNTGVDLDEELSDDDVDYTPEPVDRRAAAREARAQRMADRPPGMFSVEIPPTPASWPPGVRPPPPRARTMALGIDMLVLVFIVLATFIITPIVVDQTKPEQADRLDEISLELDGEDGNGGLNEQRDAADAKTDSDSAETRAAAKADVKRLDKEISTLEDEQTDLRNEILPITLGFSLAGVVLSLLYLVPVSVRTGRTFGKRFLQIRAVMVDGSPLTLRGALRRYGTPMILGWMLANIFGPLGYMMVLFGVLTWPRNPNLQGLQDRLAKTIVVDG
ncbi:MAG TPA: RDD family protein [Acidimicrobiia bacterium]|nr:RDD family protein [Acidimicrobiia bacterium]